MNESFHKIASKVSAKAGTSGAFLISLGIVLVWGMTGPLFKYSNTWQLVINTGTTIITFLMVFLIQNTQNRDAKATQLKLDELIRSSTARDSFVGLEDLSDEDLATLDKEFVTLHDKLPSSIAMKKMREKINAENSRRSKSVQKQVTQAASQVYHSVVDPFKD